MRRLIAAIRGATSGAMIFNRIELMIEAARAGYGIVQVPECYVQPYIARGELVEALESYKAGGYTIYAVYRQPQRLAPRVRAFIDFLLALFDPPPWQPVAPAALKAPASPRSRRQ